MQQDIKILTHSWISYFLEAYNYALPYLIDSFIEFYGEEYRNYITETIKSIKLDFIINASALKVRNYPKFMKKDITNIRKYLEEVTRYLNTLKHKLPKEELDSIYIKFCSLDNPNKEYFYPKYQEMISNGFIASSFVDYQCNSRLNGIILPIITLGNIDLIHEINHIICTHIIALFNDFPILVEPFKSYEVVELINQLTALQITRIFESKKVSLLPKIEIPNYYNEKLRLVTDFYNRFEQIMKKVLITGDTNLLEASLGNDNLDYFYDLVEREYNSVWTPPHKLKQILGVNESMSEHLKNRSNIDYETFYNELESMGYRVRRIK